MFPVLGFAFSHVYLISPTNPLGFQKTESEISLDCAWKSIMNILLVGRFSKSYGFEKVIPT